MIMSMNFLKRTSESVACYCIEGCFLTSMEATADYWHIFSAEFYFTCVLFDNSAIYRSKGNLTKSK